MAAGLFWRVAQLWSRSHRAPVSRRSSLELVEAIGTTRFIEPRVTGGFEHGRHVVLRSGDATQGLDAQSAGGPRGGGAHPRADRERPLPRGDRRAGPSPTSSRATWRRRSRRSSRRRPRSPKNPRLQSDLAAAYLARARRPTSPRTFPKALEAAENATGLRTPRTRRGSTARSPSNGSTSSTQPARPGKTTLQRDATSPWADEAQSTATSCPGPQSHAEEDSARARAAAHEGQPAIDRLAEEVPTGPARLLRERSPPRVGGRVPRGHPEQPP